MSANPGQGIENEYSQEILFRPLSEMACSVDGGDSKKTDRTFHISVPVTNSSNLFSTEAVSVTGFCCTTMLSFDMTETRAIRFCPKEVPSVMQKRSIRRQVFVTFLYVERTIIGPLGL